MGNTEGPHPAEAYLTDLRVAERRAMRASIALGVTLALRLALIPISLWQNSLVSALEGPDRPAQSALEFSDSLQAMGGVAQLVVLLVTGVLYLQWLHRSVRLTRALGSDTLRWTPKEAVLGFVIPFINITRPYQIMRDLHDHLGPDVVPEPQVQVVAGEMSGYRGVEVKVPPPPARLPHASIGAWWGFFWVGNVVANMSTRAEVNSVGTLVARNWGMIASDAIEVVSAGLAVVMVRAVTARLVERYRRIAHTPVEALAAAGIRID